MNKLYGFHYSHLFTGVHFTLASKSHQTNHVELCERNRCCIDFDLFAPRLCALTHRSPGPLSDPLLLSSCSRGRPTKGGLRFGKERANFRKEDAGGARFSCAVIAGGVGLLARKFYSCLRAMGWN
jgi:hypothetical protein